MHELYYYIKGSNVKRLADLTTGTIAEIAAYKAKQTL